MNNISKTIWIIWLQGYENAPEIVKHCIHSWEKHNPGYDIKVLDKNSLFDFIELPAEIDLARKDIPAQKISALSRLAILSKYGGIWVDATVYCCRGLDEWLPEYLSNNFFAFRNPGQDRLMSNWFIVSDTENIIIKTLTREFTAFFIENTFSNLDTSFGRKVLKHLSPVFNSSVRASLWWHSGLVTKVLKVYPYYIFHYTFNKLILKNRACREEWNSSKIFEADVPHSLQKLVSDNDQDRIKKALEHIENQMSPVYKLNWRDNFESDYWKAVIQALTLEKKAT
jgi:hypothetical protein